MVFKKKAHYLLVEILIAIAIIGLLCLPLIRNPLYLFKSQIKSLEKIECERLANLSFLDIKLMFHNEEIPFNISIDRDRPTVIKLKPAYIELSNMDKKEIQRSCHIWHTYDKITQANDYYRLINIRLNLKPSDEKKPYTYKHKLLIKNH